MLIFLSYESIYVALASKYVCHLVSYDSFNETLSFTFMVQHIHIYSGKPHMIKMIALCVRNGCYLMLVHVIARLASNFSFFAGNRGELSQLLPPWILEQEGSIIPQYDFSFCFLVLCVIAYYYSFRY
jgi:hypothetical protein